MKIISSSIENKEEKKEDKDTEISIKIAKRVIPVWKKLKLKAKEIKFLTYYVNNGFNASEAYKKSHVRKGKSKETSIGVIRSQSSILLTKRNVRKAFIMWKTTFIQITKPMLEPALLDQLKKRAFYDIEIFYNKKGKTKELSQIPKEWRCCIDGIERKFYGKDANIEVITYKLADKDKSMDKLEKYIDMIKEKFNPLIAVTGETKINLLNMLSGKNNE